MSGHPGLWSWACFSCRAEMEPGGSNTTPFLLLETGADTDFAGTGSLLPSTGQCHNKFLLGHGGVNHETVIKTHDHENMKPCLDEERCLRHEGDHRGGSCRHLGVPKSLLPSLALKQSPRWEVKCTCPHCAPLSHTRYSIFGRLTPCSPLGDMASCPGQLVSLLPTAQHPQIRPEEPHPRQGKTGAVERRDSPAPRVGRGPLTSLAL
jgi:hypothetical protein